MLLPQTSLPKGAKLIKEVVRVLLFFSKRLRRLGVFWVDYHFRIRPDAARIAELLRSRSAELLYLNNQPSSNLEGMLAATSARVPVIQHSRIEATLNAIEVRIANKRLRKIICVSEGVKRSLLDQGIPEAKCVVVHNGIDGRTTPRRPPEQIRREAGAGGVFLIGTVGSLIPRKRIADLLEAVAVLVHEQRKAVKCLIVGTGPEEANLSADARRLGIAERVIFTGFQSDAVSYINAVDIFCLPSEKEGLPRVILEAMLMAKPVVASRVTGSAELVVDGQTGFLLPPGDIRTWADILGRLVDDAALRRSMGDAGRRRVLDGFSIEKYVTGVSAVFDQVSEAGGW